MPFLWTVNPYRGCEYGCKYCYARYTHEFMEYREPEEFETHIFAKQFSMDTIRGELRRIPLEETIGIGTATDPYQPAERKFRRTRLVLEALSRDEGRRISITTKSDLVARDVDLLAALSQRNDVSVHMTITTLNSTLARLLEPYAPRPDLRLAAVETLARAGVRSGVTTSPVLPGINDDKSSLDAIARAASMAGARHWWANVLFLKPCAAQVFLPFLDQQFPHLASAYRSYFSQNEFIRGQYPERIREMVMELRQAYGLNAREQQQTLPWQQLDLELIEPQPDSAYTDQPLQEERPVAEEAPIVLPPDSPQEAVDPEPAFSGSVGSPELDYAFEFGAESTRNDGTR